MAEATTLRDFLSRSDHSIRVPREQYHFDYVALDPIEQGKGVVYCKASKRDYEAKELKRVVVGHGESPVSVDVKARGWLKTFFGNKQRLPLFGGKGVQMSRGA